MPWYALFMGGEAWRIRNNSIQRSQEVQQIVFRLVEVTKARRNTKKIASAAECGQDEVHVRDEWK